MLTQLAVKITGNKKAVMQYKSYDKDIVLHHGIELVGWTEGLPFACPSSLPATLEPLQRLLRAIDDGECHFRRLGASERALRREEYNRKIAEGAVAPRRTRKDKGGTRKTYRRRKQATGTQPASDNNENEDEDEGVVRGKKRARKTAAAVVPSSSSEDEE